MGRIPKNLPTKRLRLLAVTFRLRIEQFGIATALCHQRFVVALLDDDAVFQNDDLGGKGGAGETVRNENAIDN